MASRPPEGQALQRVCPHCSTIAVTAEGRCPWCRRSYRRRLVPWVALLALLQVALTVGGIALVLVVAGRAARDELDDQVDTVQRDVTRQVDGLDGRLRRELERELDRRLPAAPATAP